MRTTLDLPEPLIEERTWSQLATNVVVSKYFRGPVGTPQRERSVRQLIGRVVTTITQWGVEQGYFATPADKRAFHDELTHMLLQQRFSFNSPVWFNVGVEAKPQCSACFILSVQDTMDSILDWYRREGVIFKGGSGSGVNLSKLRSSREALAGGGTASGPVSFMRAADASAGVIKSGGKTRRAAKMVVLNVDHPDVMEFIRCKVEEERKASAAPRPFESVLVGYEIPDKAVERGYHGTLAQLDYLEGNHEAALRRLDAIKALEEKPADKLLSGTTMRSLIAAAKANPPGSEAYRRDVAVRVRAALVAMPYAVVGNDVREIKASAEIAGEPLIVGSLRERLQPIVDKAGSLSSDFAPAPVNARYRLLHVVPLKAELVGAYTGYLAENKVDKPEIWSKREVTLKPGERLATVNIAVWDSGVDTKLFADRLVKAGGKTAVIGFDRWEKPAHTELQPVPPAVPIRLPAMPASPRWARSTTTSPRATRSRTWATSST